MRNYLILVLLLKIEKILNSLVGEAKSRADGVWYNPLDYNYTYAYNLLPVPSNTDYASNNTCVNVTDLVKYNYTDLMKNWNNPKKVFPENFCYSALTYNISREDFFDIINKNLQAFYNYKRLINLWTLFNYTTARNMESQCAGFMRNMACWTMFPACIDNGNETWTASPICSEYCEKYLIRCGDV